MVCKYCHSKDHQIDVCPSIICKNCKSVGHAVWLCPSSAPVPALANPNSPGLVIDNLPEEVEERKESTLASTYWKKDQMVYNFSTNSLSSPKNASSPRIPSAASLRETQSGLSVDDLHCNSVLPLGANRVDNNGNHRDQEKRRRDRERDREKGKKKNGWVSSEQGGNQNPSRNSGNNRYGGSEEIRDFRNVVQTQSQRSVLPQPPQVLASLHLSEQKVLEKNTNDLHDRSMPKRGGRDVRGGETNLMVPQRGQELKSSAHVGSSILSRDMRDTESINHVSRRGFKSSIDNQLSRGQTLESVFGGSSQGEVRSMHQTKFSGSCVSIGDLPSDRINEEIKSENVTTRYYQKMIHLNWGDIVA